LGGDDMAALKELLIQSATEYAVQTWLEAHFGRRAWTIAEHMQAMKSADFQEHFDGALACITAENDYLD